MQIKEIKNYKIKVLNDTNTLIFEGNSSDAPEDILKLHYSKLLLKDSILELTI